jgi:photoactive yellow protein
MLNIPHDLNFDSPNLAECLDSMSAQEINLLPFGVLKISFDGKVELFSKPEAEQSGYGTDRLPPVGLDFYIELAPCMNTPEFRGQIEQLARQGHVDFECGHTGDYGNRSRHYQVRIISAESGGFWQIHDRTNSS